MIKALIFDMDNTLADSEVLHYRAWKETLAGCGVGFTFDEFTAYVGASNESLAADYIRDHRLGVSAVQLVVEKQRIYLELISTINPMPGVREMIGRCHGNYRLAVASSSDSIELESILEIFGLRHCFEQVIGGNTVSRKKPNPEIYLKARDMLGLESHECVAFEDSEAGIAAARGAGMIAVAVPHGLSHQHDFSRADLVVSRIDQVDDRLLTDLALKRG